MFEDIETNYRVGDKFMPRDDRMHAVIYRQQVGRVLTVMKLNYGSVWAYVSERPEMLEFEMGWIRKADFDKAKEYLRR